MEFEKIRTINKRKVIIGGLIGLSIIAVGVIATSRAKYRTTESFNIVNGTISYKVPDFNIVAMYSSEDGENYIELTERMPESGYTINESKSYCNLNGSKDTSVRLYTNSEKEHIISNLIKGDKCYLYFDKDEITAEDVLGNLGIENPKEPTTNMFASVATTDEGVFSVADPVYGGTSYYYRGAVTNNYVKFANFCWRIIRINGDGSIRMIYDGESCHANGTDTTESIAISNQVYNLNRNRSEYVGYTYEDGLQRPSNNATASASNLKTQTDDWYNDNIKNNIEWDAKVAKGKFCNNRDVLNDWSSTGNEHSYSEERLYANKKPTLNCSKSDVYTLKAGAITADEVSFAGGVVGTTNSKYYLYNGQAYWTITPYYWNGTYAIVAYVRNDGNLFPNAMGVDTKINIRPVINLRADTIFSSGDGSQSSPFTVQ